MSIQAHPNQLLAAQLHARDPKNYPDANHKPEMLVAISERFSALCGFRPSSEIVENLVNYPELVSMCDKENCDEFISLVAQDAHDRAKTELSLRKCFTALMNKTESFIVEEFTRLRQRLNSSGPALTELDSLFLSLAAQYPNDVGCFAIFMLNCLTLRKGEAIFLAANVPHAYLLGDGVECMACSDNVVRAGLTPKFKDVKVLCDMLDYSMRSSDENKLAATHSTEFEHLCEFRSSVDEFSVQQVRVEGKHLSLDGIESRFLIPKCSSGSILILNEVKNEASSRFEIDAGVKLEAKAGLVYFINANTDVTLIVANSSAVSSETLVLGYKAYCDIKSS